MPYAVKYFIYFYVQSQLKIQNPKIWGPIVFQGKQYIKHKMKYGLEEREKERQGVSMIILQL